MFCEFLNKWHGLIIITITRDGKKEYPCKECAYVAGDFYRLRRHQNSVHLGIKFPCDQCQFAASDSSGLTRHKKSKHEGNLMILNYILMNYIKLVLGLICT